jgi:hypothetical protein
VITGRIVIVEPISTTSPSPRAPAIGTGRGLSLLITEVRVAGWHRQSAGSIGRGAVGLFDQAVRWCTDVRRQWLSERRPCIE